MPKIGQQSALRPRPLLGSAGFWRPCPPRKGPSDRIADPHAWTLGEARVLLHREGIHVGPQQNRRALAIAQKPDDAGTAHALADLVSLLSEPLGGDPGGPPLLHGEFGVGVNVLVHALKLPQEIARGTRESRLAARRALLGALP